MQAVITQAHIEQALTYTEYRHLMMGNLDKGLTTDNQDKPKLLEYTSLNLQRMQRVEKKVELMSELVQVLQNMERQVHWLVISEGWCGDSAQNIPVMAMLTDAAPTAQLHLLLREQHPEVTDAYLTNGSRSIPKLICLDAQTLEEIFTWGPRPVPAQQMAMSYKSQSEPKISSHDFAKELHMWYARDRGATMQQEFLELLKNI